MKTYRGIENYEADLHRQVDAKGFVFASRKVLSTWGVAPSSSRGLTADAYREACMPILDTDANRLKVQRRNICASPHRKRTIPVLCRCINGRNLVVDASPSAEDFSEQLVSVYFRKRRRKDMSANKER